MSADRISIQLAADTDPLTEGLGQASDSVKSTADQMGATWQALTTSTTAQFAQVNEAIQTSFAGIGTSATATQIALQLANQAMASDFAALGQTMTSSWQSTQGALTAASSSGAATRLSLEQSAASQGLASLAQSAIKAIANNALSAFAGVFANLSPSLGPTAAAPAAAAQATVAAAAGSIAYPQNKTASLFGWRLKKTQWLCVCKYYKPGLLSRKFRFYLCALANTISFCATKLFVSHVPLKILGHAR